MKETFLFRPEEFKDIRHAHVDFMKNNSAFLDKSDRTCHIFQEKDSDIGK